MFSFWSSFFAFSLGPGAGVDRWTRDFGTFREERGGSESPKANAHDPLSPPRGHGSGSAHNNPLEADQEHKESEVGLWMMVQNILRTHLLECQRQTAALGQYTSAETAGTRAMSDKCRVAHGSGPARHPRGAGHICRQPARMAPWCHPGHLHVNPRGKQPGRTR